MDFYNPYVNFTEMNGAELTPKGISALNFYTETDVNTSSEMATGSTNFAVATLGTNISSTFLNDAAVINHKSKSPSYYWGL